MTRPDIFPPAEAEGAVDVLQAQGEHRPVLLDEALAPVDRDVFRRQNRYYAALAGEPGSDKSQPGAAGDGAAAPTPKDEK